MKRLFDINLKFSVSFVVALATPYSNIYQIQCSFFLENCKPISLQSARTEERQRIHNSGNVRLYFTKPLQEKFSKPAGISVCWLYYLSGNLELPKEFGFMSDIKYINSRHVRPVVWCRLFHRLGCFCPNFPFTGSCDERKQTARSWI